MEDTTASVAQMVSLVPQVAFVWFNGAGATFLNYFIKGQLVEVVTELYIL